MVRMATAAYARPQTHEGLPNREPLAPLRCRFAAPEPLTADPDGPGSAEPQGAGDGAVEVPVAAADERAAVVDRGHDAATAVADRHLRAARQRAVGHAVVRVEATRRGAAVLVPRGERLVVRVDRAGA